MAQAVQGLVEKNGGKEQHAIQSFANALRKLPTIMADNAGLGARNTINQISNWLCRPYLRPEFKEIFRLR